MTELTFSFFAVAVLTGLITSVSVWAPRQLGIKLIALGAAAIFLATIYAAYAQLLSRPKPVALEWWLAKAADAGVLGSSIRENEGIYLWLQVDGAPEPRAYILPWSRDLAEQLQATLREAEQRQSDVRMRLPFERSFDDREPKFYALPQPALPPKDFTHPPAQTYERHAEIDT
ncbi:MAG TPA: hypothetical protein VLE23_02125 [Geminicoccaceae bacterium]|nr:hypothetical protein [Geminicoccaceae bacterium]